MTLIEGRAFQNTPRASGNVRPAVLFGYSVIILLFGGLGGWAATAPLASAVIAPGTVVVESNRKTVQHFEGGIINEILVDDSDYVEEGAVLMRLESTQARASSGLLSNQLAADLALEARLLAERDHAEAIAFPDNLVEDASNELIATILDDERRRFRERRSLIEMQIEIFQSRISQFQQQIEGLNSQQEGMRSEASIFEDELVGLRQLFQNGYYPRTGILQRERELARLEGEIGGITAEIARAEEGISEARLEMQRIQQQFQEEVGTQLRETRNRISDLRERSAVADDVLRRVDIIAPQSGIVQNLLIHTIGGIVQPGEPLLEIVPTGDTLVINAKVSPLDIDNVTAGLVTEVRLAAFSLRGVATILGEVISVSPDLIEEANQEPYFLARVEVDESTVPEDVRQRITPGMPADIIIQTGERTVLHYIMAPITDILVRSMREE